ncbi:hypothetical protein [Streptomyces decoyicus]|uniref:hypothetical protein n=1 Tax=Streptomyces decoyicus TaxID=249567 RepID=UPI0033A6A837
MISTTTGRYWSTGITVTYAPLAERINDEPYGGWHAELNYCDDGFANNDSDAGQVSTQGSLATRYPVRDSKVRSGLSIAIDTLLADAERLGVDFTSWGGNVPRIYYRGDGEDPNHPAPKGWRDTLKAEAERIGWAA